MSLSAGDKLGRYEILERIGAGGMGEVYRARDTRLGREVAVKTSAAHFTERFEREARAIAALNHPNICTLHDVGPNYLVMEYVEGEAPKGPLPLNEALRIARQIADALEAAHEKGITHRDLKPGNIKIKPDGVVKVLDFGLAKIDAAQESGVGENSPTLSMAATRAGVILGTAAYMSPEQARGKPVDKRADIWSFGVVLYEILTGERVFKGEDLTEILASVVKERPDLSRVPEQVRPLIEHCLEKDPKNRLHDIGDMDLLLRPSAVARPHRAVTLAMYGFPWLIAATSVAWVYMHPPVAEPLPVRFQLAAITDASSAPMFRISPNGRLLAYTDRRGGKANIYLRPVDSLETKMVPNTENVIEFFWSPDSAALGYFADGKLKRVGLNGEPPQALLPVESSRGGAWTQGSILYVPGPTESIYRIPDVGGTPERVTPKPGPGEGFRYPESLPDGKHFFVSRVADDPQVIGVYIGSLDGKPPVKLLPDASNVAYADGHLFFVRQGVLMVQGFDASSLQLSGEARPISDGIRNGASNLLWWAFDARPGILAYQAGRSRSENVSMVWMDLAGRRTTVIENAIGGGRLSPDGRFLTYRRFDPRSANFDPDLWIQNPERGSTFRLAAGAYTHVWSTDATEIAYVQRTAATSTLYRLKTNGAAKPEMIGLLGNNAQIESWSPDGKTLAYITNQVNTGKAEIMLYAMEGEHKSVPYLHSQSREQSPRFSPDGRWMAYASDESGHFEVYVQAVPATAERFTISSGGGQRPRWRADGKELYFQTVDGKIMAVPVKIGTDFDHGPAKKLIEGVSGDYEPTRDGQRFLLTVSNADTSPTPPITVLLNWQVALSK